MRSVHTNCTLYLRPSDWSRESKRLFRSEGLFVQYARLRLVTLFPEEQSVLKFVV